MRNIFCVAPVLVLLAAISANAQERAFYAGKTINVLAPYDGAGSYPQIALALADELPRHLPGKPAGVAQFMPGAGGLKMANYLYRLAPRDGTTIAILFDGTPAAQLYYAGQGVDYRADEFLALGTLTRGDQSVLIVRADSPITSVADARTRDVVIGGAAAGAGNVVVPQGLNLVLGTHFKVLMGYPTMASILLAMEQREVDGTVVNWTNLRQLKPDWIAGKTIRVLAQVGFARHKDLPDVPLISELAEDARGQETLQLVSANGASGKGIVTTPGAPADRLALLRAAFVETLRAPDFIDKMNRQTLDLDPQPPEFLAEATARILRTDPQIVSVVRGVMEGK